MRIVTVYVEVDDRITDAQLLEEVTIALCEGDTVTKYGDAVTHVSLDANDESFGG